MPTRFLFAASLVTLFAIPSLAHAEPPALAPAPAVVEPPTEPEPPRVTGVIVEVDTTEAEVFVDGKSIGHAPFVGPLALASGRHVITAQLAGRPTQQREVDVRDGETSAIVLRVLELRADVIGYDAPVDRPAPPPEPRVRNTAIILTGGSLAAVALVTGVALNLTANAKVNQARALQTSMHQSGATSTSCTAPSSLLARDCTALHDALVARDTYASMSLAGYVVAGVAAAATIAYVVWPEQRGEKKAWLASVRPAPMVGAGTGGFQLAGSF